MKELTAYINAGGQGSRLHDIFRPDPARGLAKALLEVGKPPVTLVDHHISKLLEAGVGKVVVGAAHQHGVADYVNEHYSGHERISVAQTSRQMGTAAELMAARGAHPELFGRYTYVCNVDTILDVSETDFLRFHKLGGKAVSIALTRNAGVPNEGAFYLDGDRQVIYSAEASHNPVSLEIAANQAVDRGSSTGAVMINTAYLDSFSWRPPEVGELSLYRHFIGAAVLDGEVAGYDNGHNFFLDVGTPAAWRLAGRTALLQPYLQYPNIGELPATQPKEMGV